MLHAIDYLSTTSRPNPTASTTGISSLPIKMPNILPVWSFRHGPMEALPASSENTHNTRQARLNFNLRDRAVCHGLAGFFEATLYPGVELSTNPLNMDKKSPDMMSWFPIFFPLKVRLSPFPKYLVFLDFPIKLVCRFADVSAHRHPSTPPTPQRLPSPSSVLPITGKSGTSGWSNPGHT